MRATFRLDSLEAVTIDILSLGLHIEVVAPQELRTAVADWARRTSRLYRGYSSVATSANFKVVKP